jgi:hypothetical protein
MRQAVNWLTPVASASRTEEHRRHSLVGLQDNPQAGQPDPKWQLRRMQRRPRRRRELKPAVTIRALIEAGARSPTDEFNRLRGAVLGVPSRVTRHGVPRGALS